MELPILALSLRRERNPRRFLRTLRQDRKLLEDEAHFLVVVNELLDFRQAALAVAAVVIEELDDRYVALRIARNGSVGRAIDRLRIARHERFELGVLLFLRFFI